MWHTYLVPHLISVTFPGCRGRKSECNFMQNLKFLASKMTKLCIFTNLLTCHTPLVPQPLGTTPPGATPSKGGIPRLQRKKVGRYFHAISQVSSIKNDKVMHITKSRRK